MLILTRAPNQKVVIGQLGEIIVSVLAIENNQVRLGFSAPKDIPIHRAEVFEKIQQQEKQ